MRHSAARVGMSVPRRHFRAAAAAPRHDVLGLSFAVIATCHLHSVGAPRSQVSPRFKADRGHGRQGCYQLLRAARWSRLSRAGLPRWKLYFCQDGYSSWPSQRSAGDRPPSRLGDPDCRAGSSCQLEGKTAVGAEAGTGPMASFTGRLRARQGSFGSSILRHWRMAIMSRGYCPVRTW